MSELRGGEPSGPTEVPTVIDIAFPSDLLGEVINLVAVGPAAPQPATRWVWLLHGHGAEPGQVRQLLGEVARAIGEDLLAPHIVVAPLAPWLGGGGWWVDSAYAGDPTTGAAAGRPIESAILTEVLPQLERAWGPPTRDHRVVAGISMGGAAALRWALVHRERFGSGVLLSPSVYADGPHLKSSARSTGAFGVGPYKWAAERYRELASYPDVLKARPVEGPRTKIIMVVGDGEAPMNERGPVPLDQPSAAIAHGQRRDLDLESTRLHVALKGRPDIDSELRVVQGGHTWGVWQREIVAALRLAT